MLLYLLAFVGGVLTILSPCILPVLPLVFSRADQPFRRSGLPLLIGMGLTFALVAGVATYAGGWVVRANQIGRIVAIIVFAILGLALLAPRVATYLTTPLVRLGSRVQGPYRTEVPGVGRSLLLGVSTGLLWAPCAGPILGLILAGAALQGPSAHTTLLLLVFAAGAAASLAVALLAGHKVFTLMKRSLGAEEWIRRALGVTVLVGVVAIAMGWDTGFLRRLSLAGTSGVEQRLIDQLKPMPDLAAQTPSLPVGNEGQLPPLNGAELWLNSAPLTRETLLGKVVLVDFWTYSCINCLRSVPYVQAWWEKYRDDGLVVIGVHTPEFAFEKDTVNVSRSVKELTLTYPVAVDSRYTIWNAFHNEYWPAHYLIDATGVIRAHHFGEGGYDETEAQIQELLRERNGGMPAGGSVAVTTTGAQAAADFKDVASPETYIGTNRQKGFASPETVRPAKPVTYSAPAALALNHWAMGGSWILSGEHGTLATAPGRIVYRFHARDLHLVLGPGADGRPIRFRVTLNGQAPGSNHGVDIDAAGGGTVTATRLYQLIRQSGAIGDQTFEIEFEDPAVHAFAFTFG